MSAKRSNTGRSGVCARAPVSGIRAFRTSIPALGGDRYHVDDKGKIVFESGIEYTMKEAMILSRASKHDDAMQAVHLIKKYFGGEILEGAVSPKPKIIIRHAGVFEGY